MDLSNKDIIHVKKGNIEYIQFRKFLEYEDKISHCFTLIGKECISYKENDGKNYKNLMKCLDLDYEGLVCIKEQIHSNIVESVERPGERHAKVDGLATNKRGITLSTREADCTPIIFYDPAKNAIANVHSGWKGTVAKIAQNAVKQMEINYGSKPEDIICGIGPCIQSCHFKVDEDVKNIFIEKFAYQNLPEMIRAGEVEDGKQKYYIDTTAINIHLLEEMGIKAENIIDSKLCTVCNSTLLHSYRVTRGEWGRNTAIIGLKSKTI